MGLRMYGAIGNAIAVVRLVLKKMSPAQIVAASMLIDATITPAQQIQSAIIGSAWSAGSSGGMNNAI